MQLTFKENRRMVEYIYFVKCPGCEDEHFDFFDDAKAFALQCLSKKPVITQVEVCRNDFGECTDSCDKGVQWSWENECQVSDDEPAKCIFTKDDLADFEGAYNPENDPEFYNIDNSVDFEPETSEVSSIDEVPDNFRKPITEAKADTFHEAIFEAIDYLTEFNYMSPVPESIGAANWEELKDDIRYGLSSDFEIAEIIMEYLKKDIAIGDKHPEIFEDDPQSELTLETYNHLKRAYDRAVAAYEADHSEDFDESLTEGVELKRGDPGYYKKLFIELIDAMYDYCEELYGFHNAMQFFKKKVSDEGFYIEFAVPYDMALWAHEVKFNPDNEHWVYRAAENGADADGVDDDGYYFNLYNNEYPPEEGDSYEELVKLYRGFEMISDSFCSEIRNKTEYCSRKPIPEGMTIEELVEAMEENEDTVECSKCGNLVEKASCTHNKEGFGWCCSGCCSSDDDLTEASLTDILANANSECGTNYNEKDFLDSVGVEDEEFFADIDTFREIEGEEPFTKNAVLRRNLAKKRNR